MARARNLKPALFENELLGMADPLCTLLFIGLWTLADREGRLEDRPLRIRGQLFPYRPEIEIEKLLEWLRINQFIYRYSRNGSGYIQIINFCKHQNPHKNEKPSELPEYVEIEGILEKQVDIIEENKNRVITRAVPNNSEPLGLTPDSLLLIPDSLNPEQVCESVCVNDPTLSDRAHTPPKREVKKPPSKIKFADDVHLTAEEHAKLSAEFGEKTTAEMIDILSNYKGAKGKVYKSDYKAIRSWVVDAYHERCNKNKAGPERDPPKTLNGKPIPPKSKTNPFWNFLVDEMEKQADEQDGSGSIVDVD